ncbi:MAG: hypothetical protein EOO93_03660 [Pedobacter sp.]|nr:MAG: hypothetical protein EOO93_03660 [Pedobacter sp.]
MPCNHKFIRDLNLENLDFLPTTLIVGTFNPAWPANNQAQWFYGRTRNNYFWDVLPALFQQNGLRNIPAEDKPKTWKDFCQTNKIAMTDLISTINDADELDNEHNVLLSNYSDNNIANSFNDFDLTDVVGLLRRYPTIKSVYLTTLAQIPFFNELWNVIENYSLQNGIHCRRLLTPSGSARYQIPAGYVPQFPVYNGVLANYILENWHQEWHQQNL